MQCATGMSNLVFGYGVILTTVPKLSAPYNPVVK
jgi:hypothetical protein